MTKQRGIVAVAIASAVAGGLFWYSGEMLPRIRFWKDGVVPLVITACCEPWPGGKCWDMPIGDCPPSHDLVTCCGPSSEPDGSVSCGC